jgi:type IV pilus assembly protein PilC
MSLTFAYRARTPSGERVSGTMRALDRSAALATLRERMLIPSAIEATASAFSLARLFGRTKPNERLAFFRAYAALEQSGVDFSTSLELLIAQTRSARMRDALESVRSDVERGGDKLWAAMSHRPDEFSDLEIAMVAAGEEAGKREEVFDRLAVFLERDEAMRKRLTAALFYPTLVLFAAALVSVYLIAFVVPEFAKLFASFDVVPSPLMLALLAITSLATNPAFLLACTGGCAVGVALIARALQTVEGALAFDALRLRLPLIGEALRKTILARLCRVVATLLQSGVHQVRALEVAVPVAQSPIYSQAVEAAREAIAAGRAASLEEALRASDVFPPLLVGFVRVGGAAGNVPAMLARIAAYYEEDVESLLAAIPTVVQTAVTLGLGAVVAVIVYVVYVPLSTLSSSIR